MNKADTAIVGGSGFYEMEGLNSARYVKVDTPFGLPSEKILLGEINKHRVAFLSRHGIGHRLNPSEINYRANFYALKILQVSQVISVSAVGSLKENLKPTSLVIPDQFFDHTFKREKTYFENGVVAHVSMAHPVCKDLAEVAFSCAKKMGLEVSLGGTYFNMEGPQFSTQAESNIYRKMDFSVIGMTQAVEAKLARELEMCFLCLSFVTDYDCWHESLEPVTVEMIIENLSRNSQQGKQLVRLILEGLEPGPGTCSCRESLKDSIITNPEQIDQETYEKLKPIIGRYIKK